jgi:hypothetical protein
MKAGGDPDYDHSSSEAALTAHGYSHYKRKLLSRE